MRSFTYSLDAECKPYGITVQLLSPSFMKTNLTKFSDFLHRFHELYIPQPTTFVVHAVNTLGIAKHTTGFLPHEISVSRTNILCDHIKYVFCSFQNRIGIICIKLLFFRNEYEKSKLTRNVFAAT